MHCAFQCPPHSHIKSRITSQHPDHFMAPTVPAKDKQGAGSGSTSKARRSGHAAAVAVTTITGSRHSAAVQGISSHASQTNIEPPSVRLPPCTESLINQLLKSGNRLTGLLKMSKHYTSTETPTMFSVQQHSNLNSTKRF